MAKEMVTIKLWKDTRKKFRLIAAMTDKSLVKAFDDLASEKLAEIENRKKGQ